MCTIYSSRNNSLDRDAFPPTSASILSAASSFSSLSIGSVSSGNKSVNTKLPPPSSKAVPNNNVHKEPNHTPQIPIINPQLKKASQDSYIIRVTHETDNEELDGIMYKCIMLFNNERTPQVVRNIMIKFGLDGSPDKWTLAQCLPDKELVMPPDANVYYALNTTCNLDFILRPKKDNNS